MAGAFLFQQIGTPAFPSLQVIQMTLVNFSRRPSLQRFACSSTGSILLATALLLACQSALAAAEPNAGELTDSGKAKWREILQSRQWKVPADPDPLGEVVWRKDLSAAMKEAKETGKPLLVTWRCLPCEQCAEFDEEILEGSLTLNPLLRRFVTVRLTDASLLDERYFPYKTHQDLDLSWWAYFLSEQGDLYGVFGGKDHVSENTRISEEAFINNLVRILKHHYNPGRQSWKIDLPVGHASQVATGPKDSQGYTLLKAERPGLGKPHKEFGSCIHCHQVGDMLNMEAMQSDTFDVRTLTDKWPLPENVGLLLERDHGLLVKQVTAGSPADRAGLKPGDELLMAENTKLFGQADFRGVLHRASHGADQVDLAWRRGQDVQFATLEVAPGWRKTKSYWRKTVYDGVYGPTMGFFPLRGPKAGKGQGLSIKPWMGPKPAERPVYGTGLRPNMEIVAINGMGKDLDARQLITWFRLNHKPEDEVTYTVRGGKEFRFVLPKP